MTNFVLFPNFNRYLPSVSDEGAGKMDVQWHVFVLIGQKTIRKGHAHG